jgi:hypothetical protein
MKDAEGAAADFTGLALNMPPSSPIDPPRTKKAPANDRGQVRRAGRWVSAPYPLCVCDSAIRPFGKILGKGCKSPCRIGLSHPQPLTPLAPGG